MSKEPTKRFSDRVDNYVKYRPSYPSDLIIKLQEEGILVESSIIADIGSGTGILLTVMILYRLYEDIAQQHMMDMNPMMRKFMST